MTPPQISKSAPLSSRVIPELNGVRGIAILLVLGFHFGARPPRVPKLFTAPFALGWSGVDLFFVLSGFLITGILLDTKPASNYFSSFYVRRVLRIFPLYLSAVAAYFLIALPVAHHFGYWQSRTDSLEVWYWCHVSNWRSAFGLDVQLLTHFWSLSVEEQFYLIWPLVVFFVPRSKMAHLCVAVIVTSLALRCGFSGYASTYPALLNRLTPFRLDTLAFGGLLATIVRSDAWSARLKAWLPTILSVAGLGFVCVLAVARTNRTANPVISTVGFTLLAAVYACLVFFSYVTSGSAKLLPRLLRSRFLVSFGKYSYAIYVLHFPIAFYGKDLVLSLAQGTSTQFQVLLWVAQKVIGVGLSFLLGLASWNMLEKHFLRLKKRYAAALPAPTLPGHGEPLPATTLPSAPP